MNLLPKLTLDFVEKEIRELIDKEPRFTKEFTTWLYSTDYFSAPASANGHSNIIGGLALHSYNVYQRLDEINNKMDFGIPFDSVLILGLLHDICKISFYKTEKRNFTRREKVMWFFEK
jgi:23S rRNA maturation-related 3'-5' exoribonuclease YhaM